MIKPFHILFGSACLFPLGCQESTETSNSTSLSADRVSEQSNEPNPCSLDFPWLANPEMAPLAAELTHNSGVEFSRLEGVENARNAFQCFMIAAEMGYPYSMNAIGTSYLMGKNGARVNNSQAFHWLREAAFLDHPYSQTLLAAMYFNGDGTEQNMYAAYFWAELARANGDPQAQEIRDKAERRLTQQDIEEIQDTLFDWQPNQMNIIPHPRAEQGH